MSYAQLLNPRPEVLSDDGIEGIIDLANLSDRRRRKIEAKPEAFFSLTYPTSDIARVIQRLQERFTKRSETPALFLFEGLKGSGKTHLLVLIYHLLTSPEEAQAWLAKHKLSLSAPPQLALVVQKYTDRPLLRLWDFIFENAQVKIRGGYDVYPKPEQILEALGDRHLVIILDELEQGIRMISDEALRRQNIGFLQMLSELGNRSPQVTLFTSVYDAGQEPGATLVRVPCVRIQFARSAPADRARVVLHRLFDNYIGFDPTGASAVIDSLLNTWRRFIPTFDINATRDRLVESYPFHPDLLTLILERVPARGGFQNIRGSLGFLANLVRMTYQAEDLITAGHATLLDRETAVRLQDLDPSGDLINRVKGNMEELAPQPLSERLASSTLLYTLTGDGRMRGATREDLIRHVMLPGADINEFEQTLMAFQKYASHFHCAESRYFFDNEENADAKVEFRSLTIDPAGVKARAKLRTMWMADVFRETESAVVFGSADETKAAVESLRKDRLRYVLAPRRLKPEERHALYHGLGVRNQVILLEPKSADFDLDTNADLIKWAQRILAATELAQQASGSRDTERQTQYEGITREDNTHILNAIKRAGLQFIRFEAFGASAAVDRVEPESLSGCTKEEVLRHLSQQLFPTMVFLEHLNARLDQVKNKLVREADREYRETLCFPVPTTVQSVTRAMRDLCISRHIGIYHARGNYSGRDPELTENELMDARIGDPIDTTPPSPPPPPPPPPPPAALARLVVSPSGTVSLAVGATQQLSVEGLDSDGQSLGPIAVAWRSTNAAAASVSSAGLVSTMAPGNANITAVAGSVSSQAVSVTVTGAGTTVEAVNIPFKTSSGALRQEIAGRLAQYEGARIAKVQFQIYTADQTVDLSTLPAGLRGSLSGQGSVSCDLLVTKAGEMSKAQIEQLCEQLPQFRGAQYGAKLDVVKPNI